MSIESKFNECEKNIQEKATFKEENNSHLKTQSWLMWQKLHNKMANARKNPSQENMEKLVKPIKPK